MTIFSLENAASMSARFLSHANIPVFGVESISLTGAEPREGNSWSAEPRSFGDK